MTQTDEAHKAKIFIVDDHPVLRRGLSMLISNEEDLELCGEAESAELATEAMDNAQPDVALVDLSLKGMSGLDLIRQIRKNHPQVRTVVISAHDESRYAERAIRAGAMGYVMKNENIDTVVDAIRRVLKGEIYLSEKMMPKLMAKLIQHKSSENQSPYDVLSDRELQVFQLIGEGLRTRDIAAQLSLSPKTVQVYREHIKRKMNIKDAVELQHLAFECRKEEDIL